MKLQNGGYVIVTHDDANIYKKVASAYENGKPILFYDDDKKCYYIDSIEKGVDIYTLVKGGKTFEVTSNNTLSSTGEVDAPTMENIKDLSGNLRFIEGTGVVNVNIKNAYAKWSLSGTHLMIVLFGTIENGTTINDQDNLFELKDVPQWVLDRITTMSPGIVSRKSAEAYDSNFVAVTLNTRLGKTTQLFINQRISFTATDDTVFRIQYDLLIDAE